MLKKLAELTVNTNADYYETIVKALEKDGFIVIRELETYGENYYSIAKEDNEEWIRDIYHFPN